MQHTMAIPMPDAVLPRVLCLAGPTGAGKTALALKLARSLDGEVINCDSRQLYRDFPIITAQPTPEERQVCPHHLYGCLATDHFTDVAAWATQAAALAREITARGRVPLLVGGTGMYFKHLLHGIAAVPPVPPKLHKRILERLRDEGAPALHQELHTLDPVLAARLHPNDAQRICRGLEVALGTAHALSWWHANAAGAPLCQGPLLVVGTDLADLELRLAMRIDQMLVSGALDEARRAWEICPDAKAPGWSGIGCQELCSHLRGEIDLDTCKTLWLRNTRAYAKRQLTWFRGRREAIWIDAVDTEAALRAWKMSERIAGSSPQDNTGAIT